MFRLPLALFTLALLASPASLAVPTSVPYAGELSGPDGAPYDGLVDIEVAIYDDEAAGDLLWGPKSYLDVEVTAGRFQIVLEGDEPDPLDVALGDLSSAWADFTIDGTALEPRQQILSVPYALHAGDAERLGGISATDFLTAAELSPAATTPLAVQPDAPDGAFEGQLWFDAAAGQLMVYSQGSWVPSTPTGEPADVEALLGVDTVGAVTYGLMTQLVQQSFQYEGAAVPIPDHAPPGVTLTMDVPAVGAIQSASALVMIGAHSGEGSLDITLTDPGGTDHVLWTGSVPTLLEVSLEGLAAPDVEGTWSLLIVDTGYLDGGTDGVVTTWTLDFETLEPDQVSLQGPLSMAGHAITDLAEPAAPADAATKAYVDAQVATFEQDGLAPYDRATFTHGLGDDVTAQVWFRGPNTGLWMTGDGVLDVPGLDLGSGVNGIYASTRRGLTDVARRATLRDRRHTMPGHPGQILSEEFLRPLGLNANQLAVGLGVNRSTISRLLSGKQPLTPPMAARLGAFFRVPARWWLLMQAEYDAAAIGEEPAHVDGVTPLDLDPDVLLTPSGVLRLAPPVEEADEPVTLSTEGLEDLPLVPSEPRPRVVKEVRYPDGSVALVGEPP